MAFGCFPSYQGLYGRSFGFRQDYSKPEATPPCAPDRLDANAILIPKEDADEAMDAATCIGCGCCVAACKNGSAMLFVSSKVSQLALLPQGRPEAAKRAKAMIAKMDELGFGNCTNTRACEAECPKNESIANIARLNREFIKAKLAD